MDDKLVDAFRASAQSTFMEMFGIAATAESPRIVDNSEDHGWDITGLVGLAGEAQGVVAVRLTHMLATSLLEGSGVVANSDKERRELETGLVGELTNIVAGAAISALTGQNVEIAPPVIIRGPNHHIGWPAIAPVIGISFGLPVGGFEVDLCVKS